MSSSSAETVYSITLDDTITISNSGTGISTGTVVLNGPNSFNSTSTMSVGSIGISGSTISTTFGGNYIGDTITIGDWLTTNEWVNGFPDWDRIQSMCETYPGLKIAFEKFKTTYHLVKDDYDTPKDQK